MAWGDDKLYRIDQLEPNGFFSDDPTKGKCLNFQFEIRKNNYRHKVEVYEEERKAFENQIAEMEKKQNLMKKLMKEMAKGGDRAVKKQNST